MRHQNCVTRYPTLHPTMAGRRTHQQQALPHVPPEATQFGGALRDSSCQPCDFCVTIFGAFSTRCILQNCGIENVHVSSGQVWWFSFSFVLGAARQQTRKPDFGKRPRCCFCGNDTRFSLRLGTRCCISENCVLLQIQKNHALHLLPTRQHQFPPPEPHEVCLWDLV